MKAMNPRLEWFMEQMREKLRANTQKSDPRTSLTIRQLSAMLSEEVLELKSALRGVNEDDVVSECADVANYAMMIADKVKNGGKKFRGRAFPSWSKVIGEKGTTK
jgi:NTP pyrophosphatase (non-canonical NTP hydrolase)